jgi:hypothetical protein
MRTSIVTPVLAAGVLALGACGSDDDSGDGAGAGTDTSATGDAVLSTVTTAPEPASAY